jgi:hypothetical protein
MRTIIAAAKQTLWDISLQAMGTCESVFEIVELNPALRPDMELAEGIEVLVPDTPAKPLVVAYYEENNIKPVSGIADLNP